MKINVIESPNNWWHFCNHLKIIGSYDFLQWANSSGVMAAKAQQLPHLIYLKQTKLNLFPCSSLNVRLYRSLVFHFRHTRIVTIIKLLPEGSRIKTSQKEPIKKCLGTNRKISNWIRNKQESTHILGERLSSLWVDVVFFFRKNVGRDCGRVSTEIPFPFRWPLKTKIDVQWDFSFSLVNLPCRWRSFAFEWMSKISRYCAFWFRHFCREKCACAFCLVAHRRDRTSNVSHALAI